MAVAIVEATLILMGMKHLTHPILALVFTGIFANMTLAEEAKDPLVRLAEQSDLSEFVW